MLIFFIKVNYLGKAQETTLFLSNGSIAALNFTFKATEIEAISVFSEKQDSLRRMGVSMFQSDAILLEQMP